MEQEEEEEEEEAQLVLWKDLQFHFADFAD